MKIKVSKILDATFARTTFDLSKANIHHSYKDHLMLELLRSDSSMAYNVLSLVLHQSEISLLAKHISSLIKQQPIEESLDIDEFLSNYREYLLEQYKDSFKLSTIHLLMEIMSDNTTATAEAFNAYGISYSTLIYQLSAMGVEVSEEAIESKIAIGHKEILPSTTHTPSEIKPRELLLERYSTNLSQLATEGKIDPIIGRENEITRLTQILSRRKKNNPILIGEAGVGKSAIVEGLALRISQGNVPPHMQHKRIYSLDMTSLIAGTKFRGEFEERLQEITSELTTSQDIILFIDEIHTIVGAGATQGSLDAANILKPALARGDISIIGATTYDEYREYIEKDAALERRFQRLTIEPSNIEQTLDILHRLAPYYERHHNVSYSKPSIEACVTLSHRYIHDREFPDKAIDLMDEAGAIAQSNREKRVIESHDIEFLITSLTGIPAEQISQSEIERLHEMEHKLRSWVIGQDEAIEKMVGTLRRARVGIRDERRPIGVFLFIGPTGVGKTLTAKKMAEAISATHNNLVRIDMSEYSLKHNVSRLIGSPPGYVGYGKGGELTEAVRKKPYAVVLLDEIEKAHPETFNILLQLLDEGRLTDGAGRVVDFRNTVIIMTSNLGLQNQIRTTRKIGYETHSGNEAKALLRDDYQRVLEEFFKPEFLNRIDDVILFQELREEHIQQIVALELKQIVERIERAGYRVNITQQALQLFAKEGYQPRYGVRALKRLLTERVENPIATLIVEEKLTTGGSITIEESNGEITHRVA